MKFLKAGTEGFDFFLLTWLPNLLLLPMISLAQENEYFNTAQLVYGSGFKMIAEFICGPMIFLYGLLVFLYMKVQDASCCSCMIMWLLIVGVRLLLCLWWLIIIGYAFSLFSVDWQLGFGFDFGIAFNLSFRFGLTSWCSVLRASVQIGTAVEVSLTARARYIRCVQGKIKKAASRIESKVLEAVV